MSGPLPLGMPWPSDSKLVLGEPSDSFHAYVHIPFCKARCGYCDFNTYISTELGSTKREEFHKPLIQEILLSKKVLADSGFEPKKLTTVFFGGGTPSLFSADQVSEILSVLESTFGLLPNCEVTLEANPESASEELMVGLKKAGINRLSFGVQSFDPEVLRVLDREHDPSTVAGIVFLAKQMGFKVSVDLIYGAPGESLESFRATLEEALELGTQHISAYSLIIEPGTKLARQIAKGIHQEVDEDLNAQKFELASELIGQAGLEWYEVANWGEPSLHNLAYWQSKDWWGYGPGAHSHIAGNRFWNTKHPDAYAKALLTHSQVAGMEVLTRSQQLEESLMLELRTIFGVETRVLKELGVSAQLVAEQLAVGAIELIRGNRIRATESGRLFVDRIVLDFLTK
ncbi:radical SAM family heme chaperone HemW [Candidatus Aquiluna sp. UB-MaderosW2red]|uniref:radical SAM family heme chaperone HemW n=1 Tax=Candidatus Aquiluna sp. UB-MaderosW2red TaxID=1855377 RepID=UPI000875AD27|nr:radical SAM family heme chaperone HemW [Candidatus Aquiluna sp. UB-MaderosW2red]SCX10529.1 oxygen-independent coproporphyrinogen-3 oxidase [Candidatus Aquiluna sp. UB-MaderosW2red]